MGKITEKRDRWKKKLFAMGWLTGFPVTILTALLYFSGTEATFRSHLFKDQKQGEGVLYLEAVLKTTFSISFVVFKWLIVILFVGWKIFGIEEVQNFGIPFFLK